MFDFCLSLNERVPIRLGVYRSLRESSEAWLGLPKYSVLAGALWISAEDTRRLPIWFEASNVGLKLPSLPASLVEGAGKKDKDRSFWRTVLMKKVTERRVSVDYYGRDLVMGEALVNYIPLRDLQLETIWRADPEAISKNREKIRGRIVLIGDAEGKSTLRDNFVVPGQTYQEGRTGVYLHGAVLHTLLNDPLDEFKHLTSLVLDFAISIILILTIMWTRKIESAKQNQDNTLEMRVITWGVLFILILGLLLVVLVRVMWLDFLLVIFFLLLHPRLQGRLQKLIAKSATTEGERA